MSRVLIFDFGSQFTQLIARRIREEGVYCEVHPPTRSPAWVRRYDPAAIVLSGGPASVYDEGVPTAQPETLDMGVPILGICYGMQLVADLVGGEVQQAERREYGRAELRVRSKDPFFHGFADDEPTQVWMSHGDSLHALPPGFEVSATTENSIAAIRSEERRIWGVQFHPEVAHTTRGGEMLRNFLFEIAGCEMSWNAANIIDHQLAAVRETVENGHVICGLSGGVDSSVAAALVQRAVGDRLTCIFVDTGLLRKGERDAVEAVFGEHMGMRLEVVDAADLFLPDVIESVSVWGPSVMIKSHHNVGGLRPDHPFELVEPLRELFKDEVRAVGRELGLSEEIVGRHPFPGPGLAIRILGDVTREKLAALRDVDAIYLDEIREAGLYDEIWQAFAVLLPVQSVGVMGDARTYENVVALRAVTSLDGMTADWFPFPHDVLGRISNRIINEVKGVNRVTYDVSSKPPATIEWE